MGEWIKQICAVVLVIMVIILILPDGKMGKYVKGLTPLVLSFVIISPLLNISEFDISAILNGEQTNIEYQEDFLSTVLSNKIRQEEKELMKLIENLGIKEGQVQIEYIKQEQMDYQIQKVKVNLEKAVINSDSSNIDIIEDIKNTCSNYLSIDKGKIFVYG